MKPRESFSYKCMVYSFTYELDLLLEEFSKSVCGNTGGQDIACPEQAEGAQHKPLIKVLQGKTVLLI